MYYFHENIDGFSNTPPTVITGTTQKYPTDGNPQTGTPATDWPAWMAYVLVEELLNVLQAAGITPDAGQQNQVATAIQSLITTSAGDPLNYNSGIQVSYVSASTIQIGTGACRSDDNTATISISSPLTAQITVLGTNGLDAGVEDNATHYYIWAIYNPTTDITAALLSTSFSTPTLPAGYTKKALLGAVYNNACGNFLPFDHLPTLGFFTFRTGPQFIAGATPMVWTNYTAPEIPPIAKAGAFEFQPSYTTSASTAIWANKGGLSTGTDTTQVKLIGLGRGTTAEIQVCNALLPVVNQQIQLLGNTVNFTISGRCWGWYL